MSKVPHTGYGQRLYPNPDPKTTALLVIDMQNDECHPEGWYAKNGIDVGTPDDTRPTMARPIKPLTRIMPVARKLGMHVIWTRHRFHDAKTDGGVLLKVRPFLDKGGFRGGRHSGDVSWGADVDDRLKEYVRPEDWVMDKRRISAFQFTDLEVILRSLGIDTVIIGGVVTWNCVEQAARDAMQRDFKVIVLGDATGGHTHLDLQDPTLKIIQQAYGDVLPTDVVIQELTRSP